MQKKDTTIRELELKIEILKLEIELEKLRHEEYWQPLVIGNPIDYSPPTCPYNSHRGTC